MDKAAPEMAFLKKMFLLLRYLFIVCTGLAIAASAGLLDGLRAMSNKAAWKQVTVCGPRTYWIAQRRWVVLGKVWTTSGVSAGLDGMMAFLRE